MAITALPPAPSRADPANFANEADAWVAALDLFTTEANALKSDVNAKQVTASAAATSASASALAASQTVDVAAWVSGTTYALGVNVYDTTDFLTYRRKVAGAGTTRPGLDSTNWQLLTGLGDVTLTGTQTLTNKTINLSNNTLITTLSQLNTAVSDADVASQAGIQSQTYTAFTTTGTAPDFVLTPTPAITSYVAGQRFRIKSHASGTTGSNTLNVSALGVKNLKQYDATGTKISAVVTNSVLLDVEYDGTDFVILSPLPSSMTGMIVGFPATTAPAGWIKANGATLSRATYAALWAYAQSSGNLAATEGGKLLGQFGPGNGSTTFSIPDVRGEFTRWLDDGRGVDSGRAIGSFQADDFKSHAHGVSTNGISIANSGSWSYRPAGAGTEVTSGATGGTETRPRNVALLACIKY